MVIKNSPDSDVGCVFFLVKGRDHQIDFNNSTIYKRSGDFQHRNLIASSLI